MTIRVNDTVQVLSGKDKGKRGKVLKIVRDFDKIKKIEVVRMIVEGVNKVTKHVKAANGQAGQKLEVEAPLHRAKISLICPKTDKPTRTGVAVAKDGSKTRIAKKSGEVIPTKWSKQ